MRKKSISRSPYESPQRPKKVLGQVKSATSPLIKEESKQSKQDAAPDDSTLLEMIKNSSCINSNRIYCDSCLTCLSHTYMTDR